MRVLLVTPQFTAESGGGGEVSATLLARELARAGHEVRVLAEAGNAPHPGLTLAKITPGAVAEAARDADVVHAYNNNALTATLRGARRAGKPAIATANSYWASCLFADRCFPDGQRCPGCSLRGLRRCFATRNPATIGRRVPAPLARLEVARRQRALAAYDRVIVLSEASKGVFLSDGIPASRIRVVPNMADPGMIPREPADLPRREPLVLFVGALKHGKGAQVLLAALPRLLDRVPETRLLLAGEGPERLALQAQARALGVEASLEFAGRLPPERLYDLYRKARALAFPVLWEEPFGRVVLEAWAAGLPVVTTRCGGPGDVVEDGKTGRTVPPGDASALADALGDVLADPAAACALADGGRSRLEDFAPARVLPRLVEVYREVAGR